MTYTRLAPIPHHIYGFVDKSFVCKDEKGWMECAWFGIHAHAGRAITLTLHLKNGAVYRHVPPHAFAFEASAPEWTIQQAQAWDCFGNEFSIVTYPYLRCLETTAWRPGTAEYLFSVEFLHDGWSEAADQTKAFHFIRTHDDRLTIQPGDTCLFWDVSFNSGTGLPTNLKKASQWWEVGR